MSDDHLDYTVDDCLEQIVKCVEEQIVKCVDTMGVEDISYFFIRDCLARLWNAAIDKCGANIDTIKIG